MDKPFLAETKQLFAHVRHHNSDALEVRCDDDFGSINSNAEGGTPVVRDRAGQWSWLRGRFARLDTGQAQTNPPFFMLATTHQQR